MPAFILAALGWIANSWLGKLVIDIVIGKLVAWAKSVIATREARKKAQEEAAKSVQPLKDAKTGEEIDKATNDALDHF